MGKKYYIPLILILIPSLIWLVLKQVHSPWWFENGVSTPFIILVIFSILLLVLIYYVSFLQAVSYFIINTIFAILLNNMSILNNTIAAGFTDKNTCGEPVSVFQFNMKFNENKNDLDELITYLTTEKYHLITLQGVSQQSKLTIIKALSPYYPFFIRGQNNQRHLITDQLIFSRYAFSNVNYHINGNRSSLISSQWQLPYAHVNLYTLHPPSPRNEKLWQSRNNVLYQLKNALKVSSVSNVSEDNASANGSAVNGSFVNNTLVIGDLNISKHSSRITLLKKNMNSQFINSWPNIRYLPPLFGLAIDHLWVSNTTTICTRQRIDKFNGSDHYAVKTQVDFSH